MAGAARYSGMRVSRVEDARLLTGHGTYVDDVRIPGLLHASFVRSTLARAAIRGIDTSAALAAPGVRAVFTAADLNPDIGEQWHTSIGPGSPETPRPPLAEDEVRFVGDPIALVVAESLYLAEDAAELVEVDFEPLTPVVDYRTAEAAAELVHEAHGSNLITELGGLPASALEDVYASAAHVTRATIAQQAYVPVPMEGRGLVVDYSPSTGDLTIHSATQSPHEVRLFCARLLGIPEHRIRVVIRDTGGGFGQKILVQRDEMCLMLAGRKLGAPVKWVEDRRENLIAAGKSRQEHADVSVALDADGVIQAVGVDFMSDCGAYPTPWPMMSAAAVGALFPGPYRVPKASFATKTVYTNTVGRTAYRGPWQFETLAREMLLDLAARESGIDPAELRRRNLLRAEDLPYTSPNGMTYDSISPLETFEHALEMLDYEGFRAEQAASARRGSVPRRRAVELRRTVDAGLRVLRDRGRDHPHRAVGRGQRVHRRRVDREQHRDHRRAADCRRARCRHRPGRDDPGRHHAHRVRRRRGRESERFDDRGRDRGDRRDPARTTGCRRRAQARGGARGHRARRQPRQRSGDARRRCVVQDPRPHGLLRAAVAPTRGPCGPRGQRPLHRRAPGRSS